MIIVLLSVFGACSTNNETSSSNKNVSPTKTPLSEFERSLKSIKLANFEFIFSLKKKDDKAFESDDKKFIKDRVRTDRAYLIDGDKTILIGTNFKINEKSLNELKERFDLEDFSKKSDKKKEEKSNSNINENTNK